MKTFFSNWWEQLRSSYWFLPSLLALGAILLSAFTLHIDTTLNPKWARDSALIWAGGAEGARSVLATIASSTITVAGVVFSITIVSLTLASSQFGPRLLRNFMKDRGTQLAVGVFVATYLYCLLVLRAVRGSDHGTVIPFLSVTCGVGFAVVSVGFLIFFIHHISASIIADNVIARVASDLQSNIDRLYPDKLEADSRDAPGGLEKKLPELFEHDSQTIACKKSGFIQAIAVEDLLQLAQEKELIIRLCRRPGQFIAAGEVLAEVVPRAVGDHNLGRKISESVFFGRDRTPTQDIEYSIDQLVEVAVRALSPGINDPFTAITCIEWLGAALIQMAGRKISSRWCYDDEGKVRVVTDATDFEGIADAALNQVRQYGCRSVAVTVRLLEVLARIGPRLLRKKDRTVLLAHARAVRDDGLAACANEGDQRDIEGMFAGAERALIG